ncbi:MAG TPA: L,D-transpeptidase [Terriglobales bacterium]|nr:L,D-transpeptidase [Terriglobales bacterium]
MKTTAAHLDRRSRNALALVVVLALTPTAIAQSGAAKHGASSKREILVSIPDRKLAVLEDGQTIRVFPVAVGVAASPSPEGEFRIVNRLSDPTYYRPHMVIPPGPLNPIGSRWIGLDRKGYGIHGTNDPGSVAKAASHGCIRLCNRDMEELFDMVRVGDRVRIAGERDAQLRRIFDGGTVTDTMAEVHTAGEPQSADGQ